VPKDQVAHSKNFVLRFVQARTPSSFSDAAAVAMSPSRGFVLQQSSASSSSAVPSNTSSPSDPTSAPTSSILAAATKDKSSTPIGAIVGGVVGGLVLIALGVVGFLLFRVLQRRKTGEKDAVEAPANPTYYPPTTGYTDTAPKYEHVAPRQEGSAQELQAGGELYEADTRYGGGR
jgi:cell division septation protein DedD